MQSKVGYVIWIKVFSTMILVAWIDQPLLAVSAAPSPSSLQDGRSPTVPERERAAAGLHCSPKYFREWATRLAKKARRHCRMGLPRSCPLLVWLNLAPLTDKLIAWISSVPKNGFWSMFTIDALKLPIAKQEVVFSRTAEAESPGIFLQCRKRTKH